MSADLAQLADDILDGAIEGDALARLHAEHGPALAAALTQAQHLRAAIAGFARPELPTELRARVLAATTSPPVLTAPVQRARDWRRALGVLAVAALVTVVIVPQLFQSPTPAAPAASAAPWSPPSGPSAAAPANTVVASQEVRRSRLELDDAKERDRVDAGPLQAADRAPTPATQGQPTATAAPIAEAEAAAAAAAPSLSAPLEKSRAPAAPPALRQTITDHADADLASLVAEAERFRAAHPDLAEKKSAVAPGPLTIAIAWHSRRQAKTSAVAKQALGTAAAAAPEVDAIRLTFTNHTVSPLMVPADALQLRGFDQNGTDIWQTPLALTHAVVIPGGESLAVDHPLTPTTQPPATVVALMVEVASAVTATTVPVSTPMPTKPASTPAPASADATTKTPGAP